MVERRLISLPSQLQLLDRLQHLAYISSSLILISGELGAGKTTLAELLFNKLPNEQLQLFIALSEPLSDAKIRTQIITQLYEHPLFDADDSLFNSISLLQQKHNKNESTVIVLDNAELLSPQLLIELAQLIRDKERFTQNEINIVLLIDENRIELTVDTVSQLPGSSYIEFKVDPLSKDEATRLLKHLFNQSDYSPQLQHQDALLKQLVTCVGLPQNIIRLADNICSGEEKSHPPLWLKTVLPAVSMMLLLLLISGGIVYILYPQFIKPEQITTVAQEIVEDPSQLLDEITDRQLTAENSEKSPSTEPLAGEWADKESEDIQANLLSVGIADESAQRTVIPEQQILALPDLEKEHLSLAQGEAESLSESQILALPDLEKEPLSLVQDEADTVSEVQALILPDSEKELHSAPQADVVEKQSEPLEAEQILVIEEKIKELEQAASSVENKAVQTIQERLSAVPASYYTLQLSGMSSKKSVQEFTAKHNLPQKNITVYQTIRNDKSWYVVIYGQYENRQAALHASKNLPGSFANMNSWIKTYQIVHQDLALTNLELNNE